jgi:fructose-1,6-bisphosphatase/inositol monophosphatase family enzyme
MTLKHFHETNISEIKTDGSPVTVADRDAERSMVAEIQRRLPSHGVVGEEFEETVGVAEYLWLLDPIDGTVSFVHGVPLYGTKVSFVSEGEPVVGVMHFPALGETVWGCKGLGSWRNGSRARVSLTDSISDATLIITDRDLFAKAGCSAIYDQLRQRVALN